MSILLTGAGVQSDDPAPVGGDGLFLESGTFFLLLESNDYLLLES